MVGLDQLVAGELVEVGRQTLGLAPGVAEDDGAAMGQHLGKHRWVDAFPDATHLFSGHDDVDFHLLADAGIDDVDRAAVAIGAVAAEEMSHLFERALRGRETDALRRMGGDRFEPLAARAIASRTVSIPASSLRFFFSAISSALA